MITTINPTTEAVIAEHAVVDAAELELLLKQAELGFQQWSAKPTRQRAEAVISLAALLRENADALARQITEEMGKTRRQAKAEVQKCASLCDYMAEHAEAFLAEETHHLDDVVAIVSFQPLGLVLGVMPWNFPVWQVVRFAVPTMLAGNGVVIKHASNVWGVANSIEQLMQQAGLSDACRMLYVESDAVEGIIEHPSIKAVSLTGSERAGAAVAAAAGKALKKSVLELGGSDPYIICADADITHAVDACVKGRVLNNGQTCIAAKRFIIVAERYDAFRDLFIEKMQQLTVGDPANDTTDVGPLAREDLRDRLHQQVQDSVAMGAHCALGGAVMDGAGFFYPPTVLEHVTRDMPAYSEELFGPVAVLFKAKDMDEAIAIANDTNYGLGAGIFSADIDAALATARTQLHAGSVAVNGTVASYPELPFGGINASGYGREQGAYGIKEFVNVKTITYKG